MTISSGAEAYAAADEIYVPDDQESSMAHTDEEVSPWIQAELTQDYYIAAVKIWDRSKGYPGTNQSFL